MGKMGERRRFRELYRAIYHPVGRFPHRVFSCHNGGE